MSQKRNVEMRTTLLKNVRFSKALLVCSECLERLPCAILDTDSLRGHITAMALPEQLTFHRELQVSLHEINGSTRVVVEARGAGIQLIKTMDNNLLEKSFINTIQQKCHAESLEMEPPSNLAIAV